MRVGDLLLSWSAAKAPAVGRAGEWAVSNAIGGATIWQQDPSAIWYGFPLETGQVAGWCYWVLGELVGSVAPQISELLTGHGDPAQLNGHFLLLAFCEQRQQWHIWTNRLGTFHAYLGQQGHHCAFGTFCPAVAAATNNRELDWYGLAGFFSWGFFPQDHTHFAGVRILKPATHLVLDAQGQICSEERYWHWQFAPDSKRSYTDTVAEFADIFHEVVAEQTNDVRAALPISGGLDSRAIVAAATVTGLPARELWPYSYGYTSDSIETGIAADIAAARGLSLRKFTIQPYLFAELDRILASVEGFQDVTQCRQAAIAGPLSENADVVLAGHWGDVWLDEMGLLGQQAPDMTAAALHKLNKQGRAWLLEHFGLQAQSELLRERVAADMAGYAHLADPDFRLKAYKSDQWSWRWTTASLRMYQTAVLPRLTFYDNRLVDFFTTVPSELVAGRRLQIDYLKTYAPDLARIIWQPYRANLYQYQNFHSWLLPARAWRKGMRWLRRRKVIARNWEVQFGEGAGWEQLREQLLDTRHPVHDHVAAAAIEALLERLRDRPDGATGYSVSMLFTFAAWLKKYG